MGHLQGMCSWRGEIGFRTPSKLQTCVQVIDGNLWQLRSDELRRDGEHLLEASVMSRAVRPSVMFVAQLDDLTTRKPTRVQRVWEGSWCCGFVVERVEISESVDSLY